MSCQLVGALSSSTGVCIETIPLPSACVECGVDVCLAGIQHRLPSVEIGGTGRSINRPLAINRCLPSVEVGGTSVKVGGTSVKVGGTSVKVGTPACCVDLLLLPLSCQC